MKQEIKPRQLGRQQAPPETPEEKAINESYERCGAFVEGSTPGAGDIRAKQRCGGTGFCVYEWMEQQGIQVNRMEPPCAKGHKAKHE